MGTAVSGKRGTHMKEVIKVGVVGVGSLGQHHARNYNEMPDCDLVGVCDVDTKAATRVASKCDCQALFDHKLLFDSVDECRTTS